MICRAMAQAIEWSLATPRINPFLPSNAPMRVSLSSPFQAGAASKPP
jgi:hypothetical protein